MSDSEARKKAREIVISNVRIIGDLPKVLSKFIGRDLANPFKEPQVKDMKDFISSFRTYINFSSMKNQAGFRPEPMQNVQEALLLSMQNLLKDNELNMRSNKLLKDASTDEKKGVFEKMSKKILYSANVNNIENFDEVIKEFYRFYVPAVLKKQTGFLYFSNNQQKEIYEDVNSFLRTSEASGGSRKRRRSSPRKSKKRSSKTTSTKGKKKGSKKSKGKKRKSQVKRRSKK